MSHKPLGALALALLAVALAHSFGAGAVSLSGPGALAEKERTSTLGSRTTTVEKGATIEEVKRIIQSKEDIPVDQQRLVFDGSPVRELETLPAGFNPESMQLGTGSGDKSDGKGPADKMKIPMFLSKVTYDYNAAFKIKSISWVKEKDESELKQGEDVYEIKMNMKLTCLYTGKSEEFPDENEVYTLLRMEFENPENSMKTRKSKPPVDLKSPMNFAPNDLPFLFLQDSHGAIVSLYHPQVYNPDTIEGREGCEDPEMFTWKVGVLDGLNYEHKEDLWEKENGHEYTTRQIDSMGEYTGVYEIADKEEESYTLKRKKINRNPAAGINPTKVKEAPIEGELDITVQGSAQMMVQKQKVESAEEVSASSSEEGTESSAEEGASPPVHFSSKEKFELHSIHSVSRSRKDKMMTLAKEVYVAVEGSIPKDPSNLTEEDILGFFWSQKHKDDVLDLAIAAGKPAQQLVERFFESMEAVAEEPMHCEMKELQEKMTRKSSGSGLCSEVEWELTLHESHPASSDPIKTLCTNPETGHKVPWPKLDSNGSWKRLIAMLKQSDYKETAKQQRKMTVSHSKPLPDNPWTDKELATLYLTDKEAYDKKVHDKRGKTLREAVEKRTEKQPINTHNVSIEKGETVADAIRRAENLGRNKKLWEEWGAPDYVSADGLKPGMTPPTSTFIEEEEMSSEPIAEMTESSGSSEPLIVSEKDDARDVEKVLGGDDANVKFSFKSVINTVASGVKDGAKAFARNASLSGGQVIDLEGETKFAITVKLWRYKFTILVADLDSDSHGKGDATTTWLGVSLTVAQFMTEVIKQLDREQIYRKNSVKTMCDMNAVRDDPDEGSELSHVTMYPLQGFHEFIGKHEIATFEAMFPVMGIPLFVRIALVGDIGLKVLFHICNRESQTGMALGLQPFAGIVATLQGGVGFSELKLGLGIDLTVISLTINLLGSYVSNRIDMAAAPVAAAAAGEVARPLVDACTTISPKIKSLNGSIYGFLKVFFFEPRVTIFEWDGITWIPPFRPCVCLGLDQGCACCKSAEFQKEKKAADLRKVYDRRYGSTPIQGGEIGSWYLTESAKAHLDPNMELGCAGARLWSVVSKPDRLTLRYQIKPDPDADGSEMITFDSTEKDRTFESSFEDGIAELTLKRRNWPLWDDWDFIYRISCSQTSAAGEQYYVLCGEDDVSCKGTYQLETASFTVASLSLRKWGLVKVERA